VTRTVLKPSARQSRDAQDGARAQRLIVIEATSDAEIDMAFASLVPHRRGAMLVSGSPFFASRLNRLVALAAHYALSAMYQFRDFAVAGGLISYGARPKQIGLYTGRVLKGEKPGHLPVVRPTRFDLVLNQSQNRKSARTDFTADAARARRRGD
jgi:putative ABC transport system substrate-binding protein